MGIKEKIIVWRNRFLPLMCESIKDLFIWIFASFLLPLIQLFIMNFSKQQSGTEEDFVNIIFVTITSFLTSVFFVTNFWQQNRTIVRMMLVISYLISFGLFLVSLVQYSCFDAYIYKWGMVIALILAVFVGFFSKYDEKVAVAKEIAGKAKNITHGTLDNKEFKV